MVRLPIASTKISVVAHAVAERQKWAKLGQEKGSKSGPDRATTTVGESVKKYALHICWKVQESHWQDVEQSPKDGVKKGLKFRRCAWSLENQCVTEIIFRHYLSLISQETILKRIARWFREDSACVRQTWGDWCLKGLRFCQLWR